MNFTVQIDTVPYKQKPTEQAGIIKKRLAEAQPITLSLSEFKQRILDGRTFSPGILSGGAGAKDWIKQQLFCIDLDNEDKEASKKHIKEQAQNPITLDEVLRRCAAYDLPLALAYATMSSSPDWLKFRLVFVADYEITDGTARDNIQQALMELFPECDGACKNRDRIFYGGKKILYENGSGVITTNRLQALSERGAALTAAEQLDKLKKRDPALQALINSFDLLAYLRQRFEFEEADHGDYCLLSPCPICGHNNDFQLDKINQTWYCHSSATETNNGGSIIDFLVWKDSLTEKEAIAHFKYELCGIDPGEDMQNYLAMRMLANARKNGFVLDGEGLPDYLQFNKRQKCYSVSAPLLAEYIRQHENFLLVHDEHGKDDELHRYENGVYKAINDTALQGVIKAYITAFDVGLLKMAQVREVAADLKSDLERRVERDELNSDENIINFRNGLYSFKENTLIEHTPDVYSTIQLPCDYVPGADNHPIFDYYLYQLCNGNFAVMQLLIEYMGVIISNIDGARFKKTLFLFGPGDTGKSQLLRLTQKLLGVDNYGVGSLAAMEERFGTSALYGKRLYGDADTSFIRVSELKNLKKVTGGDFIDIEFKGKTIFPYHFSGLTWFCGNALPRFGGDRGSWTYDRLITVHCDSVIPKDKQDARLLDKLYKEREAIISDLLIPAATRAVKRGYRFDIPDVCMDILNQYRIDNSPVLSFYSECCVLREANDPYKDGIGCREIFENAYKSWYSKNCSGGYSGTKQSFRKEISDFLGVTNIERRERTKRYFVFTLNDEAKQEFGFMTNNVT